MLPSPPAQDPELQDIVGKRWTSPPSQDTHLHPSTEQPELLPNTDRETPQPLPSTQQPIYVTAKDSFLGAFMFLSEKFRISIRMFVGKCFKLLNHSERMLWWMNPSKVLRLQ
jgi:hypothetical protein